MNKIIIVFISLLTTAGVFAQEKVFFSETFKSQNQGKYKIEINELKELLHIMIAITKSGLENDDMIQQNGQYYKDVLAHFKPYENEDIIKTFDSLMVSSLYNYIFLTGNAITYDLKGNKLRKSDTFIFTATGVAGERITVNPIITYRKQIEAFARKSGFRKFYKAHLPYYSGIIADYEKSANLGRQWKWLEENFETKLNSYIIYCSPLINGLNFTGEFINNDFRLIHMNLPPLDNHKNLTGLQNELLNTRIMFTEIDHNYVNAPSKANEALINELFKDRKHWVNEQAYGTTAYPVPIDVFDEYMTYGIFLLYCNAHYEQHIVKETQDSLIAIMTERGFPEMKDFTDKLLKASAENPGVKIDKWYPDFIKSFNN